MQRILTSFTAALLLTALGCQNTTPPPSETDILTLPWDSLEAKAQNATVQLMMWQGDPFINAYMNDYIKPEVQEQFGIDLQISSGQGAQIVQTLLAEIQAGKSESELDLMWINGETFFQLREIDALFGPWTEKLPNAQYVNFENPFIGVDFQQPVNGMEMPWGNVQMTIIYNSEKVPNPPQTMAELETFVKNNPGRFTFDTQFTGMTFLKALLIELAGGKEALSGPFDEAKYKRYSAQLWDYINRIKPYFWKEGQTFPEGVAPMHQMFANGELWFTMSNNDAEVDNKIQQGLFDTTARAYVPEFGSIQNSHYLGIPKRSGNKAAAMVVANFMLSPEAQLQKADPAVWGDGTVLAMRKLPDDWREKFQNLPTRNYSPKRSDIQQYALMELAPEYMIRLYDDFRTEVIEQ